MKRNDLQVSQRFGRDLLVNIEKYKVKATYNNKEDIHMGLGGKGGSGGEAGQDGKGFSSRYILLIVLFIILIVVGVSYSGLGL